jgi:hypothetical protein
LVKQSFAAIILGGTGQVGGATVAELLAISDCREVVMVTRKPTTPRSRVRNVVLDTGAADFAERTAALAREVLSQGPVSAVSCVGVGSGSTRWSEEELKRLELGVVGHPERSASQIYRNRRLYSPECKSTTLPLPVSSMPFLRDRDRDGSPSLSGCHPVSVSRIHGLSTQQPIHLFHRETS